MGTMNFRIQGLRRDAFAHLIDQSPDVLRRCGVDRIIADSSPGYPDRVTLDDVRLKLHAITPSGNVLRGMPAVALAWAATPPYRWLGRLVQLWPFASLAAAAYHITAHVLWAWNRACGWW